MSSLKPVIVGCTGLELSHEERRLFSSANPLGLILFARNIDNPSQVTRLTNEFRSCVGRADAPVLIDQEGGRVARLRPPHWDELPPAALLGELYRIDPVRGIAAAKVLGRILASQLSALGINVDCTPVLDLRIAEADKVIGDRAFSADPKTIAALGRALCDGLRVGGVMPVIKHLPGHGRAMADSHHALPVVETSLDTLEMADFSPFSALRDMPIGMTAHILYTAIDREKCATLSPTVISTIIRQQIGFNGLLLSDDLGMKALSGTPADLAVEAVQAGCDVALYCQHDLAAMTEILERLPLMSDESSQRYRNAVNWMRPMNLFDPHLARAEFSQLISNVKLPA